MPLFSVDKSGLQPVQQTNFSTEKDLQRLIERNIQHVFNCRLVASEFSTGVQHAGRIDTLALSEDSNPVIIEYKKVESSDLVNQSLFYLAWLNDHRGDFELAAQRALGPKVVVDWSDMRVICIAPNYKKYDLHAVQVMRANIELWTYRLFANGVFYLDEVLQKSYVAPQATESRKNPVMVAAGKKAALTRASSTYTFDQHVEGKPPKIKELASAVQEFVMGLDPAMEEAPKKHYVAYRISQNIVCMEIQKKRVSLFLKLDPKQVKPFPSNARDVSKLGHFGTGDLELNIRSLEELEAGKSLITAAYQKVGG